jgi:hypothetical protein
MSTRHTANVPRSLRGYILAYVSESLDSRDICIYGDQAGLRSLGEALIAIADLDQSTLSDRECPPDDSFHQHYKTGMGVNASLPRLTVGRVDEKASGRIRDFFPTPE